MYQKFAERRACVSPQGICELIAMYHNSGSHLTVYSYSKPSVIYLFLNANEFILLQRTTFSLSAGLCAHQGGRGLGEHRLVECHAPALLSVSLPRQSSGYTRTHTGLACVRARVPAALGHVGSSFLHGLLKLCCGLSLVRFDFICYFSLNKTERMFIYLTFRCVLKLYFLKLIFLQRFPSEAVFKLLGC